MEGRTHYDYAPLDRGGGGQDRGLLHPSEEDEAPPHGHESSSFLVRSEEVEEEEEAVVAGGLVRQEEEAGEGEAARLLTADASSGPEASAHHHLRSTIVHHHEEQEKEQDHHHHHHHHVASEELPSDVALTVLQAPGPAAEAPMAAPAAAGSADEKVSLPWRILIIIYGVLVGDAIASTVITPFVPDMCRSRFGIDEDEIGMASGALIGAYSLASFSSSFYLGHLADKYGRKVIVLCGLMSGALGTFLFGMAPNFPLAFAARIFAGFFNANVPVTRAVCADVTEGQARILSFAYISACFSLSRSISSGIGGAFTNINFEGWPIFEDNKFLFPCLLGGLLNFFSFLTVLFFLPETKRQTDKAKPKPSLREGLKVVFKDWLMSKLIFASCIGSFCNGGLLVAMVLFYSLSIEHHGLGFDPLRNGFAFTIFAGAGFIFQVYAFKKVLARLGVVKMYMVSALLLCAGAIVLPSISFIYWIFGVNTLSTISVWVVLITVLCVILATGFMCYLSTLGAMLSNSCDDSRQGLTMGVNQSSSSLFRALGPFVIGMVFSLGVALNFPFFGFWILALLYLASFLVLFRLSPLEKYRVGDKGAEVHVIKEDDSEEGSESAEMFVIGEADDDLQDDSIAEVSTPLADEVHPPDTRPQA